MKKQVVTAYILIAYGWSWLFWSLAIAVALLQGKTFPQNAELLAALLNGGLDRDTLLPVLLAFAAGYGPFLAALIIGKMTGIRYPIGKAFRVRDLLIILAILLGNSLLPALPILLAAVPATEKLPGAVSFILLFFVYQALTAGTEEFGWRGFLLPTFHGRMSLWKASVRSGFLWAFWHTPIVLYMFAAQGMNLPQMLSSFAGFVAGIVGMSAFLSWWYTRTKSIGFMVLVHAAANTIPLAIGFMAGQSFLVAVGAQLLMWGVVFVLVGRFKADFEAKSTGVNPACDTATGLFP